jgi:carbonic anhydrase
MRRGVICAALFIAIPLLGQDAVTADQLWAALAQGNQSYMAGTVTYRPLDRERAIVKDAHMPPVTVLACSDSRVPPELIFNQSIGALFVVRSAGGVVDDFGIASLEYALGQGHTRLVVVLGHENCGAVREALSPSDPLTPALQALATRIRMSFVNIPYDPRDPANLRKAIEANTRSSAAHLLAASKPLRDAVQTKRVKLVTAFYELGSGAVKKLD